jgi:hypothetical protein
MLKELQADVDTSAEVARDIRNAARPFTKLVGDRVSITESLTKQFELVVHAASRIQSLNRFWAIGSHDPSRWRGGTQNQASPATT